MKVTAPTSMYQQQLFAVKMLSKRIATCCVSRTTLLFSNRLLSRGVAEEFAQDDLLAALATVGGAAGAALLSPGPYLAALRRHHHLRTPLLQSVYAVPNKRRLMI